MRLAGELADGFILSFVHKELIGEHVAAIRGRGRRARPAKPEAVLHDHPGHHRPGP